MTKLKNISIICSLLSLATIFASCRDEVFPDDNNSGSNSEIPDGKFALGFTVTLDAMGGGGDFNPLEEWENYIDPEKFRVLFFDDQERFLFESKSRWVKRQSSDATSTSWYVSVPFYGFGNDLEEGYDWDYESIRLALLQKDFKIALLVNRPLHEYSTDYATTNNGIDGKGRTGWFDNSGPHWKKHNSYYGYENKDSIRRIIDLHHCQFDPVYLNKSRPANYNGTGFYDFVADGELEPTKNTKAMMGCFKSWVMWEGEEDGGTNKFKINNSPDVRRTVHPSKQHPIPMYGMQNFTQIDEEDWKPGTTLNLSRKKTNLNGTKVEDLPISLLRSCVKLELVVNRNVDWAILQYSNICSRTEPMNIWTPTNEIWGAAHSSVGTKCETDAILDYGPITKSTDPEGTQTSPTLYWQRLSWFYGAWKEKPLKEGEKRWDFGFDTGFAGPGRYGYPNVYNSMIQRNSNVLVYHKDDNNENIKLYENENENGKNYHLIAYTGERNINDVNTLDNIRGSGSVGSNPVVFWVVKFKNDNNLRLIPITDYQNTNNPARLLVTVPNNESETINKIIQTSGTNTMSDLANKIWSGTKNAYVLPLIRNHVYRLYMSGTRNDGEDMIITSEHKYTKDITFPNAIKRKNNPEDNNKEVKSATLDTSAINNN